MAMNFGIAFPYNITRSIANLSRVAEESGWDGVFLGDAIWCEDPMSGLTAMAVSTTRLRFGTLINPVPLRRPWKIASESIAIDLLSNGRLTLGLGTGATFMGWQGFPDEVVDSHKRSEMLDETIDILTLLYAGEPFDYDGKHYHLKLMLLDKMYYPPKPIQQPRIPLWIPAMWPHNKSMLRGMKCDGIIIEKVGGDHLGNITPEDVQEIVAFVKANREATTPFDIVLTGKSREMDAELRKSLLMDLQDAGATWWIEGMWDQSVDVLEEYIIQGHPFSD